MSTVVPSETQSTIVTDAQDAEAFPHPLRSTVPVASEPDPAGKAAPIVVISTKMAGQHRIVLIESNSFAELSNNGRRFVYSQRAELGAPTAGVDPIGGIFSVPASDPTVKVTPVGPVVYRMDIRLISPVL